MCEYDRPKGGVFLGRQAIPSADLSDVTRQVQEDHPDWTPERLRDAVQAYREFMTNAGDDRPATPDVDVVWETHILYHTGEYMQFCRTYIGTFVHHAMGSAGAKICGAHIEDEAAAA